MAFRFGDPGGRGYNAVGASQVNLLAWWNGASSNPNSFAVQSGGGRVTGSSLRLSTATVTSGTRFVSKVLDAQATWGIAFGLKLSALPALTTQLFVLTDSGSNQCDLRLNTDGSMTVTRNGTSLGSTSVVIPVNVYLHIEWKTLINGSTGTTEVRINGISVLSLTGQNTRATANSSANGILIGNQISNVPGTVNLDYDDIIIWDAQTNDAQGNPDIHDFIGDCGLAAGLPTGAGTNTQWTPLASTNFSQVNEATPDGDTSYVLDSTIGHIDTYAMANLPAAATTVKSMAVMSYARKDDAGSRTMAAELRTNSANFVSSTTISLGNSYLYYFSGWGQNPSGTPADWTVADINAIEAGQKVLS